ncbi:MAG: aspartate kinase [Spirochaetaceae bacterium]|nr:aspartate kinase [Spirochaetaceae bacterium]
MIVCKFGGSSVADADQLKKVKYIVSKNIDRQILIVSAPGKRNKEDIKVTDLLYASSEAAKSDGSCKNVFAQVRERFLGILNDLKLDSSEMIKSLDEVELKIDAGAGTDYAASRGEYLNARLISIYFGWEFVDAEELIVINDNGTINENTWNLCKERLSGSNYIIPGFYGKSLSNKVKTFSRGGSDISGSIIAKAVGASLYENWTDVAGCYNADPRYIDGAYPIPQMTYREVRELSIVGASVFHPEAIIPVHEAGIPINIKNTNADEEKGTMITLDRDDNNTEVIGVSGETGFTKLSINKLLLMVEPSIYNVLISIVKNNGITPILTFINPDSICWFFPSRAITDKLLENLKVRLINEFNIDSIEYKRELSIIGLVGQGLKKKPVALAKSICALNDSKINIDSINYGASEMTLYISVDEKDSRAAVQSIFNANFK